ncbi:GNAT family N-acetyltransferase [Microlunatus speluncae]|uniref:GNAT family N-acetyltransferase n=1 Tax=Microlunatus speluncae TaxID=2594267 RepID=UPI0012661BE9|nr:GNAT family N-acetyltransferase [Microlunatus speluncae]
MPELIRPLERVHRSFVAAMEEFRAEGRGAADDLSMVGSEIRGHADRWSDPAAFAGFVATLLADAEEEAPRPAGYVPGTTLWYVDGDDYLGRLAIRHRLTPKLLEVGGHIGYDVRPSARRRGHATAMLKAALPLAYELGIDSALVTCDEDNLASAKVIEHNGGVYEDSRSGKRRYWVSTSP